MKKVLLFVVSCLCLAGTSELKADGVYAGVTSGLNIQDGGHHVSLKNGFDVNAAVGYRWDCGLRIEGEVGYHRNNFKKIKDEDVTIALGGHVNTWSGMANVLYSFPIDFALKPYVGAGIGYSNIRSHVKVVEDGIHLKGSLNGFAHQLIAGAECPITEDISLDTKYRYQKVNNSPHSQAVEMGLVYAF